MALFKSTRDQFVAGQAVKEGDQIDVDAAKVSYLVSRGFLVAVPADEPAEAAATPAKGKKAAKAEGVE